MTLLFLTLVLVGPYALLTLAGRLLPRVRTARRTRARVGLSLFFLVTASAHFVRPAAMAEMLPPWVPYRLAVIYVTGVLELLGAVGVWIPAVEKRAGACLILLLVGVLPSNVYAAIHRVPFGGHEIGPLYLLVRIPFQLLVIGWVYHATAQDWLHLPRRAGSRSGSAPAPLR